MYISNFTDWKAIISLISHYFFFVCVCVFSMQIRAQSDQRLFILPLNVAIYLISSIELIILKYGIVHYIYIYTEGYSESTEPIDAVNILPLARFEPTTSATPPSTTPDINATNCATESSPKKDVQEALILVTTDAVHVVYWFFFNGWHLFRSQVKA